ncbi:integrin alpha [Myxococcota bacterium]|nr:integrin alpha [Myxococcota bacterium]
MRVGPRGQGGDGAGVSLSLRGWGRGGSLRAAPGAIPAEGGCDATGRRDEQDRCLTRVDYARGDVVEWWENRREGLEQGFTLASPPRGDGPLVLEVAVGGADVEVEAAGTSAVLRWPGGDPLRYAGLRAWDGRGVDLPATMEASAGGVRLVVDDSGAVGPVTVDPLLAVEAWTAESDQASAYFGQSVASAGDVNGDGYGDVVVGALTYDNGQTDEGRAFLFLGSASGLSTSPAWTAESDQAYARFGCSVASAGDVNGDGYGDVAVGACDYDNGQSDEGRVYLYRGTGYGLDSYPSWTTESDQAGAALGWSVASAGDVNGDGYGDIVVGAHGYDNGQSNEGRAFLYLGSPGNPSNSPAWTAESDQDLAAFGWSVASAGDVNGDGYGDVVVGAYGYDHGATDEGRAFVFLGSASGLSPSPAWTAESDQASANFGWSVAPAGDVNGDGYGDIVVGAYRYDDGQTDEGGAFVFLGSASGLSPSPAWTAESDQASAYFGFAVAPAGDVNGDGYGDVVVGVYRYDGGQTDEGGAFLYLGSASGLRASPSWTAEPDQAGAYFGHSVAPAGDVNGDGYGDVVVGAYGYDHGETDEGRAFVYLGSGSGLATSSSWTGESDQASGYFGYSVASAGDVNGDGYGDVVVGAASYDNGETNEGRAYLFLGSASGLQASPSWTAEPDQAGAYFGWSVASAGDVNGDGYGDVVVGAAYCANGEAYEGAAFLYLGSASGLQASPSWTAESDQSPAMFGSSVSSAGDVNGDGYGDVIVGAPYFSNGQTYEGRATLFLGSASGLQASPSWTAESDQDYASFGWSVSSAGDVNGDGYGDVVVGAYEHDGGESNEGRAFLYLGSANGLQASPSWTAEPDHAGAYFGGSVAAAGDVNGDGYGDVVVGAHRYDNGETDEGRAFLYLGSASGLEAAASWTAESDQSGATFGRSVSSAGDVDGDGYGDVIVGADQHDGGEAYEGRAYVFLGSASGLQASPAWTAEPDQSSAAFGYSVSSAGDVNGDGFGDVVVGAYTHDGGESNEGRASLYLGNGGDGTGPGLALAAQARQPGETTPVAPGLTSDAEDGFDVAMALARAARGRSRVKLEVEVRALGQPFDGTDTVRGESWVDSGLGGTALQQALSGLTAGTGHHWRARVLVDPASGGGQLWGPWVYGGLSGAAHHGHVYTAGGPGTPTPTPTASGIRTRRGASGTAPRRGTSSTRRTARTATPRPSRAASRRATGWTATATGRWTRG